MNILSHLTCLYRVNINACPLVQDIFFFLIVGQEVYRFKLSEWTSKKIIEINTKITISKQLAYYDQRG